MVNECATNGNRNARISLRHGKISSQLTQHFGRHDSDFGQLVRKPSKRNIRLLDIVFAPCEGIRIPESGKFLLGIRNPGPWNT